MQAPDESDREGAQTMADSDETAEQPAGKSGKMGLILGVVGALAAGGGGFFAVSQGLILAPPAAETETAPEDTAESPEAEPLPDVAFVPLEPIMVSLQPGGGATHLRFRAELEVPGDGAAAVTELMPRVIDVLNGYLRAVEPSILSAPDALTRLRAQMLRRVRMVVGEDRVNDLLVMEFVLT